MNNFAIKAFIMSILPWIIARMKEPSTWKGLIALAAACGVVINPEYAAIILAAGVGMAGFINVVITDPNKDDFKAEIESALNDVIIPTVVSVIAAKTKKV